MINKKINVLAWLLTNSLTFSGCNNCGDGKVDKEKTTGGKECNQKPQQNDKKDDIIKNIYDELVSIDNVFSDKNHEKEIKKFLDELFKSVFVKDSDKKYILNNKLTKDILGDNLKNCFFAYNDTLDKTLFIFNEDLTQEIKKYKFNSNVLKTKLKELLNKEDNNFIAIEITAENNNKINKIELFRCTSSEDKSALKFKLEDEEKDILLEDCQLFYDQLKRTVYGIEVKDLGVNKKSSLGDIKKRRSELKGFLERLILLTQYIDLMQRIDKHFNYENDPNSMKLFIAFKDKQLHDMTKEIKELEKKLEEKRNKDDKYIKECKDQIKCGKEYAIKLNTNADGINKVKDFIESFSQKCVDLFGNTDYAKEKDINSLFKGIYIDFENPKYSTQYKNDFKKYIEECENFIYSFFENINIDFSSLNTIFKDSKHMLLYLKYYFNGDYISIKNNMLIDRNTEID